MEIAVVKTGDDRTDTINRSIQVYDLAQKLLGGSDRSLMARYPSGETERVHII